MQLDNHLEDVQNRYILHVPSCSRPRHTRIHALVTLPFSIFLIPALSCKSIEAVQQLGTRMVVQYVGSFMLGKAVRIMACLESLAQLLSMMLRSIALLGRTEELPSLKLLKKLSQEEHKLNSLQEAGPSTPGSGGFTAPKPNGSSGRKSLEQPRGACSLLGCNSVWVFALVWPAHLAVTAAAAVAELKDGHCYYAHAADTHTEFDH
eukprot:1137446-Pelagomonas_calceolata.AAC.7